MALAAASLLSHSQGLPTWRVLDTGMSPERLLSLWQAWRSMKAAPRVLHLVVICPSPASVDELLQAGQALGLPSLSTELAAQWSGLLPGFQRLSLADGRLQLTLCWGELLPMLREQQFEADSVWLDSQPAWDLWSIKALARTCRRGAGIWSIELTGELSTLMAQTGFHTQGNQSRYDPPWKIKTRHPVAKPIVPDECVVIGAGLAGAAVAASLARRGWQVSVFDAAAGPASGASGLPVGLLVPHVSSDDSPRSRLSRAGLRLTRQEANRLLHMDEDWSPTGVLERRLERPAGLPAWWPQDRTDLSQLGGSENRCWLEGAEPALEIWHPQACWIKPSTLVRAWLSTQGVEFLGRRSVHRLKRIDQGWELLDQHGHPLGRTAHVVLANASGTSALLHATQYAPMLPPLQSVYGLLSHGKHLEGDATLFPPYPVNGLGSLIPRVPTAQGLAWYAGATYGEADDAAQARAQHQQENLSRLARLLPAVASTLAPSFSSKNLAAWDGVRCHSPDRLPVVGPLDQTEHPGLWVCAAMGSRGLNFSCLCAELLAARMGGEPLPVEKSIARRLDLGRFKRLQVQQLKNAVFQSSEQPSCQDR